MESETDIWQRCARKLALNTPSQLSSLGSTIQMIIQNCLDNPTDQKYFKIKTSGKTFQTKISTFEGGTDFLIACGFTTVVIDDEKYFQLLEFDKEHLDLCMSWLLNTISTCHEMRQRHKVAPNDNAPCAECTIQIRLPNNTTAIGGFMRNDTIRDVLSFASCYFQFGRYTIVYLLIYFTIYGPIHCIFSLFTPPFAPSHTPLFTSPFYAYITVVPCLCDFLVQLMPSHLTKRS